MNARAVIQREMRVQSRSGQNYWMRVVGAAFLVLALAVMSFEAGVVGEGDRLFGNLNTIVFLILLLAAPLMTADCLSSERREGTLPLLFLTPLTPRGIVMAKGLVHGVRGLSLIVAALPVMCVPFLMGGAGWKEAVLSVIFNLSALLIGLGGGLLASSRATQWKWAVVSGVLLSVLLMVLASVWLLLLTVGLVQLPLVNGFELSWRRLWWNWQMMPELMTGFDGEWSRMVAMASPGQRWAFFGVTLVFLVSCGGVFLAIVRHVARRLRESVHISTRSVKHTWWHRVFASPRFWRNLFHARMRRTLEANPIAWLHQYSTGARMTKWLWALAVGLVGSIFVEERIRLVPQLGVVLLLGMAFAAAGSFQRERETGVMELLLVSTLTVRQIVWGRVLGLWLQFLPAMVALLVAYLSLQLFRGRKDITEMLPLLSSFVAMAPIGLRQSLAERRMVLAWMKTLLLVVVLPLVPVAVFWWLFGEVLVPGESIRGWFVLGCYMVAQIAFGILAWRRLQRELETRQFEFV